MEDLRDVFGLGVAGNFAGHLEQAGEAADFVGVSAEAGAPKGVFPFYVPGANDHFLGVFPLSAERVALAAEQERLQIEPEVGLLCQLEYDGGGVSSIEPRSFAAYNDCSRRVAGASKISQKKNWGACSKGLSATRIEIDRFAPGGILDRYRIACFLERDGQLHTYGVDSAVSSYSYFYGRLLDWLVDRLRTQADAGPLEDVASMLERAGRPSRALISVGATRYTDFGEQNFLQRGDTRHVVVYDAQRYSQESLAQALRADELRGPAASLLSQRVVERA